MELFIFLMLAFIAFLLMCGITTIEKLLAAILKRMERSK